MAIQITPERATELLGLASAAQMQEKALANELQSFYFQNSELKKTFNSWINYSVNMGATPEIRIIKGYYKYITSIGTSDFLIDHILNDTINDLQEDNQKIATRIVADFGLRTVLKEFTKNKNLAAKTTDLEQKQNYEKFAYGNKTEATTYAQIIKNLMSKKLGKGIKIHDTSPHEFQESVLFDIGMSINDFPFNMEVKSGIQDDYMRSRFDYGSFSQAALAGGVNVIGEHLRDDTYKALLPTIGLVAEELVNAIYNGNVTNRVIENFAVNSAIAYIKWRMDSGHYPVFVKNKQINTCSEIINGLLQGKGYVDLTNFKLEMDNTRNVITRFSTSPYVDFMDGEIKNIQKKALEEALKKRAVLPRFKARVSYGKMS